MEKSNFFIEKNSPVEKILFWLQKKWEFHGKFKIFLDFQVLEKVYNGDKEWVEYEMAEIIAFNEDQAKENEKAHASGPVIWRILKTPHVLKACFIGSMLQAFQQLAGINTILYYTADIIRSSGISNNHTTIWISVLLSLCNFIGPFVPMSLIEKVGRRIIFLFSCGLVVLSLVFIGVAFLLVNHDSAATLPANQYGSNFNSSYPDAKGCMAYRWVICNVKMMNSRLLATKLRVFINLDLKKKTKNFFQTFPKISKFIFNKLTVFFWFQKHAFQVLHAITSQVTRVFARAHTRDESVQRKQTRCQSALSNLSPRSPQKPA